MFPSLANELATQLATQGCLRTGTLDQDPGHRRLTVVDDALVQQPLHDADGRVPIRRLLVVQQPVHQLAAHKAVWVSPQVVAPVLDHLPLVEPKPGGREEYVT